MRTQPYPLVDKNFHGGPFHYRSRHSDYIDGMTPGVGHSRSPGPRRMQYNALPPTTDRQGSVSITVQAHYRSIRPRHHAATTTTASPRLLLLWNVRVRGTTTSPEVSVAAVSNPGHASRGSHAGRTVAQRTVKPCMRNCLPEPVKTFTWGASITEQRQVRYTGPMYARRCRTYRKSCLSSCSRRWIMAFCWSSASRS